MTQANWKQLTGFVKYDGASTIQDRLSRTDHLVARIRTNLVTNKSNTADISQDVNAEVDFGLSNDLPDPMLASEGAHDTLSNDMANAPPSAGISSRGCIRRMSQTTQDSVAQLDFYDIKECTTWATEHFELSLHHIAFIQAYPQAPIETDMYMELPMSI
ncbi:hypothetical protein ACHAW6_016110 [Cyclotella cf. meneghiniana]